MPRSSPIFAASLAELARRLVADGARDRRSLTERWRRSWLPARLAAVAGDDDPTDPAETTFAAREDSPPAASSEHPS